MREIVVDHSPTVGPADEHRLAQARLTDNGIDVAGPTFAISVSFRRERLIRVAMSTQVERDEAEVLREVAFYLSAPGEVRLGKAVDEEDFRARGVAPFLNG